MIETKIDSSFLLMTPSPSRRDVAIRNVTIIGESLHPQCSERSVRVILGPIVNAHVKPCHSHPVR